MKKHSRLKYTNDMPRRLYTFFTTFDDPTRVPSFQKFARSVGGTLDDLNRFRKHEKFERAYRECSEIRRDYLIDSALTRRFDPSFVKFILSDEFSMSEDERENSITLTLEVVE